MNNKIILMLSVLLVTLPSSALLEEEEKKSRFGFLNKITNTVKKAGGALKKEDKEPATTNALDDTSQKADDMEKTANAVNPEPNLNDPKQVKLLIRETQALLINKGFSLGLPDGVPGEKTRMAICQYQHSQDLEINPKPTLNLVNHLQNTPGQTTVSRYPSLVTHQCNITHINNVARIDAVENHTYEGALTEEDRKCTQVVAPFKLKKNLKLLLSTVQDNVMGILRGKNHKVDIKRLQLKAKKANWLPLKAEEAYGDALHNKRLSTNPKIFSRDSKRGDVKRLYAKGDAALDKVLSAIEEEYPYSFKLFVVDDRSINAEAIPGGYIYVNSGVLKSDYADLVMAHEIAHILQRHTTRELQAALIDSVETLDDLKKLLSVKSKDPVAILEKALLLRGALVQYSQKQELQSDACAVQISMDMDEPNLKQKIDHYITAIGKNQVELRNNTSTHPAYIERENLMKNVYEESSQHSENVQAYSE